ncbi:MAG: IS1595 family transposase [Cyclobacteriaceae bacterium]
MEQFKGTNLIEFMERFSNEEKCKNYLMEMKWKDGFECDKCAHTHYWVKKDNAYVRVCKSCRHINSITANTLFHKVKFPLRKAFLILFEMATTTKSCSSPVMARKLGINQKTAWLFMTKVRAAMSSSGTHPLEGICEVDEILIGGKQSGKRGRGAKGKKKASVLVEKDNRGGIKRAYGMKIDNFSTKELMKIFDKHITNKAKVDTDLWRSYTPLKQKWDITQSRSDPNENFQSIHRFIQQLKGWIRGIFHRINDHYLQGYLDEFCFRLNRHLFRDTIFHTLVNKMMSHQPVPRTKLIL